MCATCLAEEAIQGAKLARIQWEEGHIEESNQLAMSALEHLARRYVVIRYPPLHLVPNLS
jgi:hypothetical protein